jgi:hypothetical protein
MMIIKEINNNNNYCIVHRVIHANTRQYEICDYCLYHKLWMYPRLENDPNLKKIASKLEEVSAWLLVSSSEETSMTDNNNIDDGSHK